MTSTTTPATLTRLSSFRCQYYCGYHCYRCYFYRQTYGYWDYHSCCYYYRHYYLYYPPTNLPTNLST